MDAIDWPGLGRGILWVFGLGLSLAALSHLRWAAKRAGVPLRSAIGWDSFRAPFFAGLILFSAGMAWGAGRLWETIAWAVLTLVFAWEVALAVRGARHAGANSAGAKEENDHEATQ